MNPETVKAKWKKLGGKESKIMDAIAKGKNKKPLFGESHKSKVNGIGVITVAAALAVAAPVIVAISKILPQGEGSELLSAAADAGGDLSTDPEGNDVEITDKGKGKDHDGGFLDSIPTPVKVIGGAAVLYGVAKATKIIK